jgi:hypothetical protein
MFQSFYFIYRQFNRYAGNRNDAYESYKNVDDVSFKSLDVAAILYLKDQSVEKKVGAKRFLDDKIYLNYIDMNIEVLIDGSWVHGVYDTDKEVFISDHGKEYLFKASRFAEKLSEGEVRFVREVA